MGAGTEGLNRDRYTGNTESCTFLTQSWNGAVRQQACFSGRVFCTFEIGIYECFLLTNNALLLGKSHTLPCGMQFRLQFESSGLTVIEASSAHA